MEGIKGWLLVYVIGSIPLLAFYSMGLSGWFFNYSVLLMAVIFVVLAAPLVLVLLKHPKAPAWNIAAWWIIVVLITLRALNVFFFPVGGEGETPLSREELPAVVTALSGIVSVSLAWAIIWTSYFKRSARVRSTFKTRQIPSE